MSNRAAIGEFQAFRRDEAGKRQPEEEPVKGYFPAVVTDGEFHAARLATRSRANAPGRRGTEVTNLFLGLAKCADCGSTMTLLNKGAPPKGARYLVCVTRR